MPDDANEKKNMSRHILPTSANLLGLCFILLSFVKISTKGAVETVIDELLGLPIILFLLSSVLSYTSIRSRSLKKAELYEREADIIFLAGLSVLTILSIILIVWGII